MSGGIKNFVPKRERAETMKQKRPNLDTRIATSKFAKFSQDEQKVDGPESPKVFSELAIKRSRSERLASEVIKPRNFTTSREHNSLPDIGNETNIHQIVEEYDSVCERDSNSSS